MEADDNKNNDTMDEKDGIDISQFEEKLQFEHSNIRKKKKRKSSKKSNDINNGNPINAVLKQSPIKKEEKKIEIPSLTRICLEMMYSNIQTYDSLDFLPQDLAAELLVMIVDRQALTRDTARPFLNTKHELIRQFCKKHIDVSRLPAVCNYGCRGFD